MVTNPLEQSLMQELSGNCTPEFMQVIVIGLDALTTFGYSEHELPLLNLLATASSDAMVQGVYSIIEEHLHSICRALRITINESVEVESLARFVQSLYLMQGWDDSDRIVDICTADAEDNERLAALACLVGTITENDALDIIGEVDPAFFKGLVRIYTEDDFGIITPPAEVLDEQHLVRIREWRSLMAADKSLGIRMVKAGYMPGGLFVNYLANASNSLSQKPNDEIAHEVLSLLVISRDGWSEMLMTWREHSSALDLEPNHLNAVDGKICKLLSEFDAQRNKK